MQNSVINSRKDEVFYHKSTIIKNQNVKICITNFLKNLKKFILENEEMKAVTKVPGKNSITDMKKHFDQNEYHDYFLNFDKYLSIVSEFRFKEILIKTKGGENRFI